MSYRQQTSAVQTRISRLRACLVASFLFGGGNPLLLVSRQHAGRYKPIELARGKTELSQHLERVLIERGRRLDLVCLVGEAEGAARNRDRFWIVRQLDLRQDARVRFGALLLVDALDGAHHAARNAELLE